MKPKNSKPSSSKVKSIIFIVLVALMGFAFFAAYNQGEELEKTTITSVIDRANQGEITRLVVSGERVEVVKTDEEDPSQYAIRDTNISFQEQGLTNNEIEIQFEEQNDSGNLWVSVLSGLVLPIGILLVLVFMFRSAQGQGNQAMSFGKSKAKLYGNEKDKVAFKDIAGNDNAKDDLSEVVEFLKFPNKFKELGAKIPKGVLLVGPPGTGKTMIARAVAGEAKVPFFSISGSEFVEMFVGVGASRVRDLFNKAKKNSPCIIFIDEIDAVGRKRGSGMGGGHDEREQTLNQILVEMDGFEQGQNVILLAATNRADVLDPALLRPGRFDRRVNVDLPDRKDREQILKVHFKNKPTSKGLDIDAMAAKTAGSSGADLANIANESAIKAARRDSKSITNEDLVEAFEKVAIGAARKNNIMSEKDKELTAYHEAGHALVGHVAPESDMVHKVTIVNRGSTGGLTWFIPPEDKSYRSVIETKDILARILGGRIAEKIVYGDDWVTTGAGNDLQKATEISRDMIVNQGMGSKDLRNLVFHNGQDGMMFDRMVHDRPYSEDTAKRIDKEVAVLVSEAAERAEVIIKANMKYLEKLKDLLIEKETVEAEEVLKIFEGSKLPAAAKIA